MSLLERRRSLMSLNKALLPQQYRQVEYIESTGQEWIDTGIIANGDTKVDVDFQFVAITPSFVFGSRVLTTSRAYTFNITSAGNFASTYGVVQWNNLKTADTLRHAVNKNHRVIYLDGVHLGQAEKQTFTTPGSLELFACYNNGTKGYLPSQMRLFSCQIFNGVTEGSRTILRDFVPCYRKSDKVGGLYDLVEGKFYENQGTGKFLIGGEV